MEFFNRGELGFRMDPRRSREFMPHTDDFRSVLSSGFEPMKRGASEL